MSQENARLAHDAIAAFIREGIEATLFYYDPDVEWITPPDWPEDRVLHGHDGVRTAAAYYGEQFDEFRLALEKITEVDGNRVISLFYMRGRIKGSDAELEQNTAFIMSFRDGKISRVQVYLSWDEALKAVGMED